MTTPFADRVVPGRPPAAKDLALKIRREQVTLLYRQLPTSIAGTLIGMAVLAAAMWRIVPTLHLGVWCALVVLNQSWRGLLYGRFFRAEVPDARLDAWERHWAVGSGISGVLWGVTATVFLYTDVPTYQLVLTVLVFGVTTGAVPLIAADLWSFYGFVLPALLPYVLANALHGQALSTLVAVVEFVVTLALISFGRNHNRLLIGSLEHRFENEQLVEELHQRNVELASAYVELDKAREAAQVASQARFRALTDLSSDWYWEQDAELRFIELSAGAQVKSGTNATRWMNNRRWEVPGIGLSGDDWAQHRRALEQHLPFRDFEYPLIDDAGETRWISSSGVPMFDRDKRFRGYHGMDRDITERKRSEAALRDAEERYRTLFEISPDGLAVTERGCIRYANHAFAHTVGEDRPEKLVGRNLADFLPADGLIRFNERLETLNAGMPFVGFMEGTLVRADGGTVEVEMAGSSFHHGDSILVQTYVRDITERNLATAQIRQLNERLEQRVAERTAALEVAVNELESFTYTVSHDLRAPLRAMDGFSRILVEEYGRQLPEAARKHLDRVRSNAQRMGQLIDDLLSFSRCARQQLSLQIVDMNSLARTVVDELGPTAPNTTITVHPLPSCRGDTALLRQVLVNLLANAIKYSRDKTQAHIDIGFADGAYYVKDNGAGFDMRYADKLFEVFSRLHRSEEFEGTGVGLAIVRRIIQRHGGSVSGEGKVGEGALFRFRVPDSMSDTTS